MNIGVRAQGRSRIPVTPSTSPGRPRSWHLSWDCLPPLVNHTYGVREDGGRYITDHAQALRTLMGKAVLRSGFQADKRQRYCVKIVFTFPNDRYDVDSCIKAILDLTIGSRRDHRVYRLEVDKIVRRGQQRTEMDIEELA